MIHQGQKKLDYFSFQNNQYRLLTHEEYCQKNGIQEKQKEDRFKLTELADLRKYYKKSIYRKDDSEQYQQMDSFIHFLSGCLQLDPMKR